MTILDWRSTADYSQLTRAANNGSAKALFDPRTGRVVMRDPAAIVELTWHITACLFGVTPAQVKAADGDARLARNRRARKVAAHVTVFRDGDAVVPVSLRAHMHHGNGANPRSIGIEIESRDGTITPEQVATLRELVPWLIAEAAKEGIALRQSAAHRQTNGGKPNDPGPIVWRLVIELSEQHGLERTIVGFPGSTPKVKHGLPIPRSWDPLGV